VDNKEKQRKFLNYFKKGGLVLELGSGGGDFLSLCAENGIKAIGVDSGSGDEIRKKLGIVDKDIRAFIKKEKAGKYDGIYARHVAEHFFPSELNGLLKGIYRALKKGGKLVLVFPNMRNIHVAMYEFWADPTHARPYTGEELIKMAAEKGFKIIKAGADTDSWDNSVLKRFVRGMRKMVTGIPNEPPDYMLVAEK
jgi:SAM-dependent methyltransferase